MTQLNNLLSELAILLDQGDEEIAKVGADACRKYANAEVEPLGEDALRLNNQIVRMLEAEETEIASQIVSTKDDIVWRYSGYDDGRINEEVAMRMQTAEIIGPHGMIDDHDCRVGLFAQTANTDYITRIHAAEELFVQIAGTAEWTKGGEPYKTKSRGDRMHHLSNQPHASRTIDSGIVAAWVWWGDISYETYKYGGGE